MNVQILVNFDVRVLSGWAFAVYGWNLAVDLVQAYLADVLVSSDDSLAYSLVRFWRLLLRQVMVFGNASAWYSRGVSVG